MSWLVTGGAGYIGAHVVRAFHAQGIDTVVVDDLSAGQHEFMPDGTPFVQGTILDGLLLESTIERHAVTGVVHLAGFKFAGVSVERPLHTYQQNVTGTAILLAAMEAKGIDRIVFSSSAAVYGTPDVDLVTEATEPHPESPYGESKLIGEWLLADQARAAGLRHTSLRYFNVVGSGTSKVFDPSPHNLFPLVFDALLDGRHPPHQRQRLPDPRWHVRARLRPRGRPRGGPRRRRSATRRGRAARAGLQPRFRRRRVGRRDHARGRRRDRHRVHRRDRAAPGR